LAAQPELFLELNNNFIFRGVIFDRNGSLLTAALAKIAEIRGQAASTLPVRMVSFVKGSAFVSM
jgi:hypothetical protein